MGLSPILRGEYLDGILHGGQGNRVKAPLRFSIGLETLRFAADELYPHGVVEGYRLFFGELIEPSALIGTEEVQQADDAAEPTKLLQPKEGKALVKGIARISYYRQRA